MPVASQLFMLLVCTILLLLCCDVCCTEIMYDFNNNIFSYSSHPAFVRQGPMFCFFQAVMPGGIVIPKVIGMQSKPDLWLGPCDIQRSLPLPGFFFIYLLLFLLLFSFIIFHFFLFLFLFLFSPFFFLLSFSFFLFSFFFFLFLFSFFFFLLFRSPIK